MPQSKKMSATETIVSTCIGLVASLVSNLVIFHYMGIPITLSENLGMTAFFTVISIIRGYFVRRVFNRLNEHKSDEHAVERGI